MYNRFAEKRRRYLREYRDGIYTGMLLTGKLDEHLKEIGDTAQETPCPPQNAHRRCSLRRARHFSG